MRLIVKLKKAKLSRYGDDGWIEIIRSELPIRMISMMISLRITNLSKFVLATQKGEKQIYDQEKKTIKKSSATSEKIEAQEYYLYLNAVEYSILELNRIIEVYHHEFIAHITDDFEIDLSKSPTFDFCKTKFKESNVYLSRISGYHSICEIRKISNDLKHSYIQEYSLSKTLQIKSFRDFDRKILVDKVNKYFKEVPIYIKCLANEINEKYPKIEKRVS